MSYLNHEFNKPQKSNVVFDSNFFNNSFVANSLCLTRIAQTELFQSMSSVDVRLSLLCELIFGSTAATSYPWSDKTLATSSAGDFRKSSMSGLKARPKQTITGFLPVWAFLSATASLTCSITQLVL